MTSPLMKHKLRWNSQFQMQNSFQERSNMAFERDAPKRRAPQLYDGQLERRSYFFSKAGLDNARQRVPIANKVIHVARSIGMQGCDFFFPQAAQHLAGRAYHQ